MAEEGALQTAIEELDELLLDGDLDEAEEKLGEALETFGAAPALLVAQTELALEQEDYEACVASADQSLERVDTDARRARLLSLKGYALYYLDRLDDARQAFNAALRQDSTLYTALIGRAMTHEDLGYYSAAMLDLDRAIAVDDQEGQPFAIRGAIYLRAGDVEKAAQDLAFAIESDPEDEESRLNLARIHAVHRRTSQAIEVLEPLVEEGEDPEFVAPAAILRSQLSLTLGSSEAALEDAERAVELMPDRPWGHLQVAACHIHANMKPGEAVEALKRAERTVDDRRDLPDLYALYAAAYDALEKHEKARRMRDEAEGVARLPAFVYGPLNPAGNIPINPNRPIDIRAIMDDLFGEAKRAPKGYEDVVRRIVDQIPQIVEQNPGVGRLHIELPEAAGMIGGKRQLVLQVNQQAQQARQKAAGGAQPAAPANPGEESEA